MLIDSLLQTSRYRSSRHRCSRLPVSSYSASVTWSAAMTCGTVPRTPAVSLVGMEPGAGRLGNSAWKHGPSPGKIGIVTPYVLMTAP